MRGLPGLVVALALLGACPLQASERVARFDVRIEVEPDAALHVTEEIAYDSGTEQRRGIFRDIPVRYSRRNSPDHSIMLELLSVTDGAGRKLPTRLSREGSYRRVRIGDPDRTVTGLQHYRIEYRARLAMLHFEAHDEVYWNVTGNGWRVPIAATSAHVTLAEATGSPGALLDVACFTGTLGATRTGCSAHHEPDGARFASHAALRPGEGLTVVVALPTGLVTPPGALERFLARVAPWVSAWLLLPLATLLGLHGYWRRAGRDPVHGQAIATRYEPPEGLEPAEVGTLVDESADLNDVTATILQLAVRGHLEIIETKSTKFLFFERKDYELRKIAKQETLKKHQRLLLSALFRGRETVRVSALRNEFYEELPAIRKALYAQLSGAGGYFAASPETVRLIWAVAGGAVLVLGVFCLGVHPVAGAGLAASGLAVAAYSRVMPRRTRKGRRAYEEILGLREFLERVDRDRLERLGANTRERFEALLPYAIVLGVADAWADAFAEIYTEPPSWYHGYHPIGRFQPDVFVSDVGRSLDTIGQTLSSQPSSGGSSSGFGGGGFSGGGFGGGGGGSW